MQVTQVQIQKPGNYKVLKLESVKLSDEIPLGHIRIQVVYCGVNYADCLVRWGVYESAKKFIGFPITPGFEVSGSVIGQNSTTGLIKNGDSVFAFCFFGGYSSVIDIPEAQVYNLPPSQKLNEMAGFPAVFLTAFHALNQLVRFYPNSKLLIHSAAGGVGSALTQLGLAEGHSLVGIVGDAEKVPYLRQLGLNQIIDKSQSDWKEEAFQYHKELYDGVFDANGADSYLKSYSLLAPTGKLICYGSHSILPQSQSGSFNYIKAAYGLFKTPKFDPLKLITDNKSVVGFNLSFLFSQKVLMQEAMTALLSYLNQRSIRPSPVREFAIDEVSLAHRHIESGKSVGKIVLRF